MIQNNRDFGPLKRGQITRQHRRSATASADAMLTASLQPYFGPNRQAASIVHENRVNRMPSGAEPRRPITASNACFIRCCAKNRLL